MRKLNHLIFTFLLTICALLPIAAQDRKPLLENIESVVSNLLPEFSLKHRFPEQRTAGYVWVNGKSFVFVWLEFKDSTEQAIQRFASYVESLRMHGFDVNIPDERLSNLGFDNYWSEDVPDRKRGLHFYKGKVTVLVTAPTDEIAEKVARQVDALLPDA